MNTNYKILIVDDNANLRETLQLKLFLCQGYAEYTIYNPGVFKSDINFLQKPIISLSLAQTISRVLDS